MLPPAITTALERARLRGTRSRLALLAEMVASQSPLSTADLIERTNAEGVPASTVYGALSSLEAAGVVRRLDFGEDFARYEISEELVGGHHHHFLCRSCGLVDDLDHEPGIERALSRLSEGLAATGRLAESHRLDILGVCARCAKEVSTASGRR
jgi:Fur family ferric uptake transcriptional regulator